MSVSFAALLGYIIPALSAPYALYILGFDLSRQATITIFISAFAGIVGYISGGIYSKRRLTGITRNERLISKPLSNIILSIGLLAICGLFISTKSIPLITGGDDRLLLQNSILWNIYILSSVGLYLRCITSDKSDGWKKNILSNLYLISAFLTAWKGTLFLFLIMRFLPNARGKRFNLINYILFSILFLVIFVFINGFRNDRLDSALYDPIYYAYWGFVNFDTGALVGSSGCLHTLPLIGCQFAIDNSDLINSTFNVFTALSPIYRDGGDFLVFIFFAIFGFLVRATDFKTNSLLSGYFFVVSCYFFLFSTNGYIFNSSFYISAFLLLLIVKLLSAQGKVRHHD